jgi:transcriptional regulator with XRE-family HTH domain
MTRLRDCLGLRTKADTARALGMSSSNLANWERRGNLPLDRVARLATSRGVNLNWLLTGIDQQAPERGQPLDVEQLAASVEYVTRFAEELEMQLGPRLMATAIAITYAQAVRDPALATPQFRAFLRDLLHAATR